MTLSRRTLIGMSAAAVAAPALLRMRSARAAEVTLRLHHFLPPKAKGQRLELRQCGVHPPLR